MDDKFDLNNISYQDSITIKDEKKIKDFYKSHIDYWKKDIIDFDKYYRDFDISNAIELVVWVSDYQENKITFSTYLFMNNASKVYFSIKSSDIINWLEKNNLIIGDKSKWQI